MIMYEAVGYEVAVCGVEEFQFFNDEGGVTDMDRKQLTELRHIIDQALNTSAEELGDVSPTPRQEALAAMTAMDDELGLPDEKL